MTTSSTRRMLALASVALVVPLMAACTESIGPSGNGTEFIEADVRIENATVVAGDPGSGKAAFLGTVFNTSAGDDQVLSIVAGGVQATMQPDPVIVPTEQNVAIQTGRDVTADFAGFTANAGTYVPVLVTFKKAGEATFEVLVVPPTGYYAEAAPLGTNTEAASTEESVVEDGAVEEHGVVEEEVVEETDATVLEEHNANG